MRPTVVRIERVHSLPHTLLSGLDNSFDISKVVKPPYDHLASVIDVDEIQTRAVEPCHKTYPPTEAGVSNAHDDTFTLVACVDSKEVSTVSGYLMASVAWNGMVNIDDIAVDRASRRLGVGRKLIEALKVEACEDGWAQEVQHFGGSNSKDNGKDSCLGTRRRIVIRAETQDNNVGACKLYKACSFEFGGYDRYFYATMEESKRETALFWYWFERESKESTLGTRNESSP